VALGALNLPSAADIERLTRRLRSVSHRLEGIEDGVGRLDREMPPRVDPAEIAQRLATIEAQLATLLERLGQPQPAPTRPSSSRASAAPSTRKAPRKRQAKAKPAKPKTA
jgi:hypothetical protein